MTLTLKELEAVAAELNQVLSGSFFAGLRLIDPETILLAFDAVEGEVRVLACIRPRYSRIHRTSRPMPTSRRKPAHPFLDAAASFVGTKVVRVGVRFGDRVAVIDFARAGQPVSIGVGAGRPRRRVPPTPDLPVGSLLFECTGHHPNLFWTDTHDNILASLVPSQSHRRDLRPGRRYQPPLPHASDRMDALRFLPAGPGTFSELVEAHYERLGRDEKRRAEEARIRRDLKRDLERLTRLRIGLERDLAEQERAAALIEAGDHASRDLDRLTRLALRRSATRDRLERAIRRIERLTREITRHGPDRATTNAPSRSDRPGTR